MAAKAGEKPSAADRAGRALRWGRAGDPHGARGSAVSAPSRATRAGRAYLDLRKLARESQRPVDELLHLYVLEAFLDRLASSRVAEQLGLKGGVLLAAFGERRATRDVDLQAQAVESDVDVVLAMACEIAAMAIDDGVVFEIEMATAEQIRDEEIYAG